LRSLEEKGEFTMPQSSLKNISSQAGSNQESPQEGNFTRRIERQTARVPSGGYLGLAIGSMLISAGVAVFAQKKEYANFIGLWAPSLLLIGIYNKLVKQLGSDSQT
jgi:hypothetical protein